MRKPIAEPAKEVQPAKAASVDDLPVLFHPEIIGGFVWEHVVREREAQLKAALAANAALEEVVDEIDATLCACRYDNKQGCNCDIHAVHNIIRALKSREK